MAAKKKTKSTRLHSIGKKKDSKKSATFQWRGLKFEGVAYRRWLAVFSVGDGPLDGWFSFVVDQEPGAPKDDYRTSIKWQRSSQGWSFLASGNAKKREDALDACWHNATECLVRQAACVRELSLLRKTGESKDH